MNYVKMAQTETTVVNLEKDVLILKFENGKVVYSINKSEELLEQHRLEAEKREDSLRVSMNKAVISIENRRLQFRRKQMEEYGYDHYTKEFYYECPESSDEEE